MFYVSYITEYPIYEPAEGGYYYAGTKIEDCREFTSWKKANKCYQEWKRWFLEEYGGNDEDPRWRDSDRKRINEYVCGGVGKYGGSCVSYCSKYIGEGARIEITRKKPVEHGWTPYC